MGGGRRSPNDPVGHVDDAGQVALEGDHRIAGRVVAVFGDDDVGLAVSLSLLAAGFISMGIFSRKRGTVPSADIPASRPVIPGFQQYQQHVAQLRQRDEQRRRSPASMLPVSQRIPAPGEYHVIWQFYLYAPDTAEAQTRGATILIEQPAGYPFGVIDGEGRGVTVDGYYASDEWNMADRACDPGEYLTWWETYVSAEDAVSAVRVAVARVQDEPDAIRQQVRAAHTWS